MGDVMDSTICILIKTRHLISMKEIQISMREIQNPVKFQHSTPLFTRTLSHSNWVDCEETLMSVID